MLKYTKLAKNIHIITNSADRFRTDISIDFSPGGAILEKRGEEGLMHFLEHCMIQRPKRLELKEYRKFLFEKNIYLNATTSVAGLNIETSGHKDFADQMLDDALEFAFEPYITEEVFNEQKEIILREIPHRKGNPQYKVFRHIINEAYTEDSRDKKIEVLGKVEVIKNAKVEDLKKIHKRLLQKAHIVVYASGGNINHEKIIKKIEKYKKYYEDTTPLPIDFNIPNKLKDFEYKIIVHDNAHENAILNLVIPFEIKEINSIESAFFYRIFLSSPHGLLFDRLRNELGLVYDVSGGFYELDKVLLINIVCEINLIPQIIAEIKAQFKNFDAIFTEEKLKMLKNQAIQLQEIDSDNPWEVVNFTVTRLETYNKYVDYYDFVKQYEAMTLDKVRKLAEDLSVNLDKSKIIIVSKDERVKEIKF